jgi:hypothetical protein
MVDVWANIGAFTFKVADAGYRVAAFEGVRQLRSNMYVVWVGVGYRGVCGEGAWV